MSKPIDKFPEREVTVTDDQTAWALCEKFGTLDALMGEAGFPVTIKAVIYQGHPTHWCLCLRSLGNADPAENGFLIRAFPKRHVHLLDVAALVERMNAGSSRIERGLVWPDRDSE